MIGLIEKSVLQTIITLSEEEEKEEEIWLKSKSEGKFHRVLETRTTNKSLPQDDFTQQHPSHLSPVHLMLHQLHHMTCWASVTYHAPQTVFCDRSREGNTRQRRSPQPQEPSTGYWKRMQTGTAFSGSIHLVRPSSWEDIWHKPTQCLEMQREKQNVTLWL